MDIFGGDPPAMRQLASRMNSVANRLVAMRTRLTAQLGSVDWKGPDADRFRDEWNSTYATALSQMAADLNQAAGNIRRDADTQERVSRA